MRRQKAEEVERRLAASSSFESVANGRFQTNEKCWVPGYASRLRGRLDDDLLSSLGRRPIAEIAQWKHALQVFSRRRIDDSALDILNNTAQWWLHQLPSP